MAYSLSNKCAKNLCKWTALVQLIIENVVTFFWNTVWPPKHFPLPLFQCFVVRVLKRVFEAWAFR